MKTIKVKPVKVERPEGYPVLTILDDQNDAHPNGYVKLTQASGATEVGDVPRVRELIAQSVLEEVQAKPDAK